MKALIGQAGAGQHMAFGQINLTSHSFSHISSFTVDDITNFHTTKAYFGD